MPIERFSPADMKLARMRADLAAARVRTDAEIEAEAARDGDAWSDAALTTAVPVHAPPSAARVSALRARLGLSQVVFAKKFGFSVKAVSAYEQGRRLPTGPASTLLRVLEMDPDAVVRALDIR